MPIYCRTRCWPGGGLMASLPIWLLRLLSLPRSCSGAAQNATNLVKSANTYMTSRKAEAQTELRNCQADLQRKSDLCDTLSTRLSSLLVAPSHPKRLSKDPPPFDGEEKDMKKTAAAPSLQILTSNDYDNPLL
jgi:hypothetical protein